MKKLILIIAFLCIGLSYAQEAPKVYGRDLFISSKCQACHTVTTQQLVSKNARAKSLDVLAYPEAPGLKRYLQREAGINGKLHSLAFKGSEEELNILVDWLIASQDTTKRLR